MTTENIQSRGPEVRVGHGYDLHRLDDPPPRGRARPMVLGGVPLDCDRGPVAHSDGDVLLHAITDAILGALALPDLGSLFPDTDARNEGRDSAEFVAEATRLARERAWRIGNLDATIVAERPRIAPSRDAIRANVARLLGVEVGAVNVKGKSHEGLDAVGEGRAIEAHAVVVMVRAQPDQTR